MKSLFPFDTIRQGQETLVEKVGEVISSGKNLIAHAPTGIGKTAAVLAPALSFALKNNKRILFVTPRHSQHRIAIETLKMISEKHGVKFNVADIVGRKGLCAYDYADMISSSDFASWCSQHIKGKSCIFRNQTFSKDIMLSKDAERALEKLDQKILHVDEAKQMCSEVCPHEIMMRHAKKSKVIIADYNHVFHPQIAPLFFAKTNLNPEECILIVDEAHNASSRIRSMCSFELTSQRLEIARNELLKAGFSDLSEKVSVLLDSVQKICTQKTLQGSNDSFADKSDITKPIESIGDYTSFVKSLEEASNKILETKKKSFTHSLAGFLSAWSGGDDGFARIISKKESNYGSYFSFAYHCLDPSLIASETLNEMHSTILMSGTLVPIEMHKNVLGIKNVDSLILESPFPRKNRRDFVAPGLTSKYSERSEANYNAYADCIAEIAENVPGNIGVYFPSYAFRNKIHELLEQKTSKKMILEESGATTQAKRELLKDFASSAKKGSMLLAVVGANFAEGVDFPGEMMLAAVVAGVPLERPNLLTKSMINYYDKKFGRGWDFAYTYPAVNRAVQAAGRCIRSETDKGLIFFLDNRFMWPKYREAMPKDIKLEPLNDIKHEISGFYTSS